MEKEWIVGKNPILEALRSDHSINKIWVAEHSTHGTMREVIQLAKEKKVTLQFVPKKKIEQVAGGVSHQGVLAYIAAYPYAELEDIFQYAKEKQEDPFILILDEIEDPHNLGSMLRTANAVGVHGVIIPKRRAVGLTATVAKASAGAIQYVPVVRVTNVAQTIQKLKEEGVWIAGTDARAKQDYRQVDFSLPVGLVIGSEGKGIGPLILKHCDFTLKLPLKGEVSSLNASVAASILMYEVYRHRYPLT